MLKLKVKKKQYFTNTKYLKEGLENHEKKNNITYS